MDLDLLTYPIIPPYHQVPSCQHLYILCGMGVGCVDIRTGEDCSKVIRVTHNEVTLIKRGEQVLNC